MNLDLRSSKTKLMVLPLEDGLDAAMFNLHNFTLSS